MMSKWKHISSLVRSKGLVPYLLPSSYTFTPNKEEVVGSRFRLRYSTTCNSYYRDWSDAIDPSAKGVIPGWDKVLYSVDSVHRHINEEVGQVYLERTPGSNAGCIKWRINFGCCGLLVDEVTIRLLCVEEYGGEVLVTLTGTPGEKRVRYAIGSDYVTYNELENSTELTLTVHFVGEPGQVTRLFPQNILRGMGYPLDIQVTLKQPLQSLGKPRMLVGLLYSSSQEIEVDGRHYKRNTTNTGQGFLHIHLLRAMDLPEGKNGLAETFSKCYLLPDAKKSTKCRTKSRKGKDPLWNEQFLIVGVNFHDVKRRALEICIADSHTSVGKKAKLLGGLRLSLGYKAVVAAQTEQVNQVLRMLKGKGGVGGGRTTDDNEEGDGINVNSSFSKWKRTSSKRVAKDKEETDNNNTESVKIIVDEPTANGQQSASSASTEDTEDSVPDSTANTEQGLGTSLENEQTPEERLFESVLASIKELEIAARNSAVLEYDPDGDDEIQLREQDDPNDVNHYLKTTNGHHDEDVKEDEEEQSNGISSRIIENDAEQEQNGFEEIENQNKDDSNDDKSTLNDNNKTNEINDRGKHSQNEADLEEYTLKQIEIHRNDNLDNRRFLLNDIKETEAILENENPPNPSENSRAEHDKNSGKRNGHETRVEDAITEEKFTKEETLVSLPATETRPVKTLKENCLNEQDSLENENSKAHSTREKRTSSSSNDLKRSPSFTFKDLGKKLNFGRRSKSNSEETVTEKGFEAKADKVMLDAEGLEMTQWTLVVDRPKQWHYCWHILRSDMTILH